ncbi:hypothetical protein GCM10023212_21110 [Luteolibacter yonseiensis]
MLAGAVGLMLYSSDERTLRKTSGEIEMMAKQARTMAILHQTPYALEFREGIVRLMPFAQAGLDETKISRNRLAEVNPESAGTTENREFPLEEGMAVLVRRWNSEDWHTTLKNTFHVWRFDPDGLCEPISVRLNYGKSWQEITFHPLTGAINDTQLEAR